MRSGIIPIEPHGTNSTMFTACCRTAICDNERACPRCGNEVVGAEAATPHERGLVRWSHATGHWDREKLGLGRGE
jgi:hypothetical protein